MRRPRAFYRLIVLLTLFAFGSGLSLSAIHAPAHADFMPLSAKTAHEATATSACDHEGELPSGSDGDQNAHGCDYTCAHHWAALPTFVTALAQMPNEMPAAARLPLIERSSFSHPFRPPAV